MTVHAHACDCTHACFTSHFEQSPCELMKARTGLYGPPPQACAPSHQPPPTRSPCAPPKLGKQSQRSIMFWHREKRTGVPVSVPLATQNCPSSCILDGLHGCLLPHSARALKTSRANAATNILQVHCANRWQHQTSSTHIQTLTQYPDNKR